MGKRRDLKTGVPIARTQETDLNQKIAKVRSGDGGLGVRQVAAAELNVRTLDSVSEVEDAGTPLKEDPTEDLRQDAYGEQSPKLLHLVDVLG